MAGTVKRLRAAGCVFAEEEADLLIAAATGPAELADLVARRVAGAPLEVILGWAEFCGLRVEVDAGVFVPRQRTAFLVRCAVDRAVPGSVVVDLCCGTGAIGLAVATAVPGVVLYAADIEPAAVACAARNIAAVGGRAHRGDLFDALPARLRGQVDLLLVNAPYVPTDDIALMPPEAREHEPRTALDGGPDGVAVHRRVAAEASGWLRPGGHLLIECGEEQAPLTVAAMAAGRLTAAAVHAAELDSTVAIGQRY
jgi:release factor glutamine methyltransferase